MTHLKPAARSAEKPDEAWPPEKADIEAARASQRDALESVLTATYPRVAGYFSARGCTRDEASELAAETLTRVVEHISELRNPDAYRTWLWKLTGSVFRDWIRSEAQLSSIRNRSMADHQPRPDELYEMNEDERRLRLAFISLAPDDQETLWMRYVEELPYSSIARVRGGSQSAARVAAHRAKRRLGEALLKGK